jgi:phosphotransferase system HPr-like phosphotransfer protein
MAKVARVAKSLDLNNMVSLVSSSIRNAISSDPFGPGIDSAANSQLYTQYRISEQQEILESITRPWDTTLASMKIDGKTYSPDQITYLAPGTKKVQLAVQTSQPGALALVQPTRTLSPGLNKVWVRVTSENGQHTNTSGISLYVYTNKVAKAVITYNKNTEVPTFAGISATGLMATELATGKDIRVTIEMALPAKMKLSQAKVLLNKRTVQLVTTLTKNGIQPLQVKPTFTTTGKADTLKVSATYLK